MTVSPLMAMAMGRVTVTIKHFLLQFMHDSRIHLIISCVSVCHTRLRPLMWVTGSLIVGHFFVAKGAFLGGRGSDVPQQSNPSLLHRTTDDAWTFTNPPSPLKRYSVCFILCCVACALGLVAMLVSGAILAGVSKKKPDTPVCLANVNCRAQEVVYPECHWSLIQSKKGN